MTDERVERLLEDLRCHDAERHALVEAVRRLVLGLDPAMEEKVMYGGILFGVNGGCCGVFAYKAHVSVEFAEGAGLPDPHGVLQGRGKHRRHIKLRVPEDLEAKHLGEYLALAFARR